MLGLPFLPCSCKTEHFPLSPALSEHDSWISLHNPNGDVACERKDPDDTCDKTAHFLKTADGEDIPVDERCSMLLI